MRLIRTDGTVLPTLKAGRNIVVRKANSRLKDFLTKRKKN